MIYRFADTKSYDLLAGHLKMGEGAPNGDYIDVNNLYITQNGKPVLPVMAEIHPARVAREEWEDRLLKMKAGGVTIVSFYLFWIKHEPVEGKFDFTGENDVHAFLELCQKHGLQCALRFGPWITAECRNGGLPEWLFHKGIPLRQNDEEYLFYVRRWYEAVYEQVKDFLYRDGGNIVMIQIENELTRRPEHLMKLKEMALEIGYTAPIYTATGWNLIGGAMLPKDEMIPMWGGYSAKPWTAHTDRIEFYAHYQFSPDRNSAEIGNDQIKTDNHEVHLPLDRYPYTYCELGTGIPDSKHRRPVITDWDNYSFALTKFGSGVNLPGYYLYVGGKNTHADGYPLNWSNYFDHNSMTYPIYHYDFQAPVGEYGNLKDSYRLLKLLNFFCTDYGEEFAPMQTVFQTDKLADTDVEHLRYALRQKDGAGYIFVNNHIHNLQKQAVEDVQFALPEGGVIPATPLYVKEDAVFFMPFNIRYGALVAEYITAQPVCKQGNTYFFVAVDGIEPVYQFAGKSPVTAKIGKDEAFTVDGETFVTLSMEEAKYLCRSGDRVLLGDRCDLVINGDAVIACNEGAFAYYEWVNGAFVRTEQGEAFAADAVTFKEVRSAPLDPRFFYELHNMSKTPDGKRRLHFYELELGANENGYLYVDYSGDSAQIYVDGVMYDDHFYNGIPWVLPVKALKGTIHLVIAEYTHDIYVDIPPKRDYGIESLTVKDR